MGKYSFIKTLLPFLPLLIFYVLLILLFSTDVLAADEGRYYRYALNLLDGFYADINNPELHNGPGYPLVICLLVLFKSPYIIIKLLNVLFLIGAVLFFYKTLIIYISHKKAIAFSYLMGLYTALLKWMVYIHSESFTLFLACGFLYYYIQLNRQKFKRSQNIILSAVFLGFLVLTKVIFGYVVICLLIGSFVFFILRRSNQIEKSLLVLIGSMAICLPYLFYSYSITGKVLYWGTQGGEILYWRTSPYPNEYGDWISADVVLGKREQDYFDTTVMYNNHGAFIQSLDSYSIVQRDSLFKQKAISNIKEHPIKYIQNTGASALRLFFNYPFSYTQQKTTTYFYILPNMFLVIFLFFAYYLAIIKVRMVPFEIRFISLLSLVYLGGIILLNGRVRHLIPVLPLLIFFIIYVFRHLVIFKVRKNIEIPN